MFPNNFYLVAVGVALKSLGSAPACYMILALIADMNGLTMSIYSSIMAASTLWRRVNIGRRRKCDGEINKLYLDRNDSLSKQNRQDSNGQVAIEAIQTFEEDKLRYSYGKKVLGCFKSKLHQEYHRNFNLAQVTNNIKEPEFEV